MEAPVIAGIAFNRDEAKLTVVGVPDNPAWLIAFWAR
jgi:aspartate kinase